MNKKELQFLNFMSKQKKLEAVRENGHSIKYIDNPSEEVQLGAVSRDGHSIKYIKNPSERVQIEAVRDNGYSIKYIDNPSEKVQLEAVRMIGTAIKHIKNPSEYIKSIIDVIETSRRCIYVLHEPNKEPLFTIGCQRHITKETFIRRIHEEDGGLKRNPHRQEYLDILNRY